MEPESDDNSNNSKANVKAKKELDHKDPNNLSIIINIEDYGELKTALMVKVIIPKDTTVGEALRKIANKGNIYLIKSNYFYGENNFDLVFVDILSGNQRILDKGKTLAEEGLAPKDNTIILRKKKRDDFQLNIIIEDYQKLATVRQTSCTFWSDQLVSECVRKVARRPAVDLKQDEDDYGLFLESRELLDDDRTLGSYGLKPNDTLYFKKKKDEEIELIVLIEDHVALNCVRKTMTKLKRDTPVSMALHKVTSKGAVGIPIEYEEKYDLVLLNTGETLDKAKKLQDYKLKYKETLIMRRSDKQKFGKGSIQELTSKDVELKDKIGQGTFGKVYKGICFGIEVAVKMVKELPQQEQMSEFKNEVEVLKNAICPNIVKLYGTIEDGKKYGIVMEWCARGSLYHVMNSVVYDFGWERLFKVSMDMVNGMIYLHSQTTPIVHRDFKSLNVLVTEDWQIKLCDFGLSRRTNQLETLRKLKSTPAWSPPELLKEEEFTPKGDVYGIGMTIWEMLFRVINARYQRPFAEDKAIIFDYQIIMRAASGARPTIPESTPPTFAALVKKCWDGEPSTRPTCVQIMDELKELEKQYKENTKSWDKAKVNYQPN